MVKQFTLDSLLSDMTMYQVCKSMEYLYVRIPSYSYFALP